MECVVKIENMADADSEELQFMFNMYVNSYSAAGQDLWFKSPRDLQRYSCKVAQMCSMDGIIAYVLFQTRKTANKISLIVHNGTQEGKTALMNLLVSLLKQNGYYIEAAGAVSWTLRKLGVPVLHNAEEISGLLNIDPSRESIELNPDFDLKDKNSQSYVHKFYNDGVVQFANAETLFVYGTCTMVGSGCDRSCSFLGGRRHKSRRRR